MGSKAQGHRRRRSSKVFDQVGQREIDLEEPTLFEVESVSGNTTPTNEGEKHVRFQEGMEQRRSERIKQQKH